jgi:RTX calcium-binding nonapeptide repeat (4 copies)
VHGSPAANIDLAPTILQAAGITPAAQYPLDGKSLLQGGPRKKMLAESWPPEARGPWASTRTPKYQYMEYYNRDTGAVQFREYYELSIDPYQLQNLYGDRTPRNDPWAPALTRELDGMKTCVGTACLDVMREPGIPRRCPGATGKPGHHLVGSQTRDSIGGFPWRNVICGRDGADNLRGKGGRDRLIGHRGPDTLVGGPGNDILDGKGGRDVCRGGPGKDRFRSCERRSG